MARKRTNPLDAVAKRFGVTVREARDIAKAVSNAATIAKTSTKGSKDYPSVKKGSVGKATLNIAKQVGETARAAATGKKGTRPGRVMSERGEYPYSFKQGKKRK